MVAPADHDTFRTLNLVKDIEIAAPIEIAWAATLAEMGPEGEMPDGTAFPMVLEARPGGRWFRDLGDNAGHLWGHVQVIKPPKLIEINGPLFMSYPAISHVQYRLQTEGDRTRIRITHRAMGLIPQDHLEGVHQGWEYTLKRIREIAKRLKGG